MFPFHLTSFDEHKRLRGRPSWHQSLRVGNGLLVATLLMAMGLAFALEAAGAAHPVIAGVSFLVCLAGLVGSFVVMSRNQAFDNAALASYMEYLRKADRKEVALMAVSPEADEQHRYLAVQAMNQAHPGWSRDLLVANTTSFA